MIPSFEEAKKLWVTYNLSEKKQHHSLLVAKLALFLASKLQEKKQIAIQTNVLLAAALLHDIDKNIPRKVGEHHPDTAVRILHELGMDEVAALVKTHPLNAILDTKIAPKSWEEKLLFLADKMVKYDIISVDERFQLWNNEHIQAQQILLDQSYQKVKELEQFMCTTIGLTSNEVIRFAKQSILENKGVYI